MRFLTFFLLGMISINSFCQDTIKLNLVLKSKSPHISNFTLSETEEILKDSIILFCTKRLDEMNRNIIFSKDQELKNYAYLLEVIINDSTFIRNDKIFNTCDVRSKSLPVFRNGALSYNDNEKLLDHYLHWSYGIVALSLQSLPPQFDKEVSSENLDYGKSKNILLRNVLVDVDYLSETYRSDSATLTKVEMLTQNSLRNAQRHHFQKTMREEYINYYVSTRGEIPIEVPGNILRIDLEIVHAKHDSYFLRIKNRHNLILSSKNENEINSFSFTQEELERRPSLVQAKFSHLINRVIYYNLN